MLFFLSFFSLLTYGLKNTLRYQYTILVIIKRAILILSNYILKCRIILTMRWFYLILGLVDRFFFWNWFRFRTGLSEPVQFTKRLIETVSFSNRFIQTGFYLGNRFKVNKKNINKRSKIKVKFKVFLGKLVPKLSL